MQQTVILNYTDDTGQSQSVTIQSSRFTIGRNPDNDLTIADPNLSRRHALIEHFDGVVQLSDCGSQNGTMVNNQPLTGVAILHNRDVITLGGSQDLFVQIIDEPAPTVNQKQGTRSSLPLPVIMAIGIVVVLFISIMVLVISMNWHPKRKTKQQTVIVEPDDIIDPTPAVTINEDLPIPSNSPLVNSTQSTTTPILDIEKAATQTMRRISTDEKAYIFPEKAIRDIEKRVETFKSVPALRGALSSLQRSGVNIAAKTRAEGISQPYLVMYMAIALTNGGQSGDPSTTAQEIIPIIQALRTTFGDDAESSLIIVAAFKEGVGSKKSHPLLARMRRIANNPVTQRNVWYLHEHGGIDAEAYNLVINVLAAGIIAHEPRKFGIEATPLTF
jgi:pSer/pThr/pTyr-binding forkhead associated (FHA) protein